MKHFSFNGPALCSELVTIRWTRGSEAVRETVAILETISRNSAGLNVEQPIPRLASMEIVHPRGVLKGTVRRCTSESGTYVVHMQFEPGTTWTRRKFAPKHFFDPSVLALHVELLENPPEEPAPKTLTATAASESIR